MDEWILRGLRERKKERKKESCVSGEVCNPCCPAVLQFSSESLWATAGMGLGGGVYRIDLGIQCLMSLLGLFIQLFHHAINAC